MKISIIVAIDQNNAIGEGNNLMWHLPDDFKWFKQHTTGKPILMGRNTMNSIGKALPNRTNIVISSNNKNLIDGFVHIDSFDKIHQLLPDNTEELMIVGGGQVYQYFLEKADRIYLTTVHHTFEKGDVFFPKINQSEWEEVFFEQHSIDEKHIYSFDFRIFDRKK